LLWQALGIIGGPALKPIMERFAEAAIFPWVRRTARLPGRLAHISRGRFRSATSTFAAA
jgi:hypothetical protein